MTAILRNSEYRRSRGATARVAASSLNIGLRSDRRFAQALHIVFLSLGLSILSAPVLANGTIPSTIQIAPPSGFHGVCQRYTWACSRTSSGRIQSLQATIATAKSVNLSVNAQVREVSDLRQYKREEYWALPTSLGGDCEDFALLKKRELIARGVAPDRLRIATVLDRNRRPHAVLVLHTVAGDYVLDNLTNRVKRWDRTGYFFMRIQDPNSATGWRLAMI